MLNINPGTGTSCATPAMQTPKKNKQRTTTTDTID